MSDKFFDEFDITMSKEPNTRPNTTHKDRLHHGIVLGTGMGKGSDDIDLMKIKPEPRPELQSGETPQMMFDTPYVEDTYATSNMVKMGDVNPLLAQRVTFNDERNKTYVYDEKPIATASSKKKEKKGKKKSGGKKKRKKKTRKKKMRKKKTRKKKTRKKKGGQEIKIGQEWEIKEGIHVQHENFRFIKIKFKMPGQVFDPRWMVWFGKSTRDFVDGQVVVMYEDGIRSRYEWIDKEADARDDPEAAAGGDLEGGRRKKLGGVRYNLVPCPADPKEKVPDLTQLHRGKEYIFTNADARAEVNFETGELVGPGWVQVHQNARRQCHKGVFVNLVAPQQVNLNIPHHTAFFYDEDAMENGPHHFLWRVYPAEESIWEINPRNYERSRLWGAGGGVGGGGAASSLRRIIPREGMIIERATDTGEGRVVSHDEVSYSTPIDFNYENEIQELNRRTRQQMNEINRIHKDEYGRFKPNDTPFTSNEGEWTRKYNDIYNRYNQQKAHLDVLKEQYQTADVVHENIGAVGAPEAHGGGRKKKTRRRKIKCGSISVKLKYKDRN